MKKVKLFVKSDDDASLAYFFTDRVKEMRRFKEEDLTVFGKETDGEGYWIVSTDFYLIDDLERILGIEYKEDFETCFDYLEEEKPHFWWLMPVNSFEEFEDKFVKKSKENLNVEVTKM